MENETKNQTKNKIDKKIKPAEEVIDPKDVYVPESYDDVKDLDYLN